MGFKPGDTFLIDRGPGKPYKAHVLAIVDDCMVVFKWYGRKKQWWHYEVKHADLLETEKERAGRRA